MSETPTTAPDQEGGSPRSKPSLPPELLEKLRQTGIRLDRQGRFWHEGQPITHAGLARALLCWLDRLPDGRPILRLDDTRYAYLEVEDAHLLVLSAHWRGDRVFLRLNDGSEEELDYASLRVAADDALYCAVRDGVLRARLTTPAYQALGEHIEPMPVAPVAADPVAAGPVSAGGTSPTEDSSQQIFALRARGRLFAIEPL